MTMHTYVLSLENQRAAESWNFVGNASRVWVRDRDWYAARAECIEHAIAAGHTCAAIVVGTIELFYRPHGQQPSRMTNNSQHGMWLHLDRACKRYGHAYVPPLAWAARPFGVWCNPTVPMVAAYQVKALQSLHGLAQPLGKALCHQGYDSYTLPDCFYYNLGDTVLDEPGTATSWKTAYENATARILSTG